MSAPHRYSVLAGVLAHTAQWQLTPYTASQQLGLAQGSVSSLGSREEKNPCSVKTEAEEGGQPEPRRGADKCHGRSSTGATQGGPQAPEMALGVPRAGLVRRGSWAANP